MSADNYYEINTEQREDGSFRFGVNMGFMSDVEDEEEAKPLPNGPRTRWFDGLDAALQYADDEYAEYGYSVVRNEAWQAYQAALKATHDAQDAARTRELINLGAAEERARIVRTLRQLANFRADYLHTEDEHSTNPSLRQTYNIVHGEIQAVRAIADAVEAESVLPLQDWLPSWRWQDTKLRELGLLPRT